LLRCEQIRDEGFRQFDERAWTFVGGVHVVGQGDLRGARLGANILEALGWYGVDCLAQGQCRSP
jgi:hypothetical protein